ncbi:MAG: hypothetical protein CM15mP74_05200 [Halieaceae bacterium]|nr:MAG: hypothetical protein CM15mP74_05200 [Halieaceae bacterium]
MVGPCTKLVEFAARLMLGESPRSVVDRPHGEGPTPNHLTGGGLGGGMVLMGRPPRVTVGSKGGRIPVPARPGMIFSDPLARRGAPRGPLKVNADEGQVRAPALSRPGSPSTVPGGPPSPVPDISPVHGKPVIKSAISRSE